MGCFVITKYLFSIHLVDICVSFRKLIVIICKSFQKEIKDSDMAQQTPTVYGVGPNPQLIHCQKCKKEVMTLTEANSTDSNGCIGVLLCLIGCWPCAFYMCMCAEGQKDIIHSCPTCRMQFGTYKAINYEHPQT